MTQKTIKALYKQPINYKLIKEGYKTIDGVINAQDGMPQVLDLPTPSVAYSSDLQYNVDNTKNGAPILNFNSFTLPDDETCEAKQYCYAPKGTDYNYKEKQLVNYKTVDETTFTKSGSITINSDGTVTNFNGNYLIVNKAISNVNSYEVVIKFKTTSFDDGRLVGTYINNQHSIQIEVPDSNENKLWWGHPSSSHGWQAFNPNYIIELNKWYWVKGVYDSTTSKVTVYMHGENDDYVNCGELSVSGCGWDDGVDIGYDGGWGAGLSQNSYIDLFESYIKINGSYWWKPWEDKSRIDVITTQIPGMIDPSVTTDNWQQNQSYKLYQLKNQSNSNVLQLTENNITNSSEKYKQYIQQVTIPARDYKWYYNGIPQDIYPEYYCYGTATVTDGVISGFGEDSFVRMSVYPHSYEPDYAFTVIVPFETGDSVTNNALLQIINRGYDPELQTYTEKSIYFSCIHNGKFSITNDKTLETFEEGIQLSTNTKYWAATHIRYDKIETYIISDNNYQYSNLPSLENWTKEYTINFINEIDVYDNMFVFGQYEDMTYSDISYGFFNGKLYIDECFGATGLSINYSDLMWEPYYYYSYEYNWYANKSLYNYTKNQNYADTLDFSDSWVNVTSNWKTQKQYTEPNVCLMPIDGGETITEYVNNGTLVDTTVFDKFSGTITNFSDGSYLQLGTIPFSTANSWEFQIKITTGQILSSTHQNIIVEHNAAYNTQLVISPDGIVYFQGSRDHTSYEFSIGSTTILSPNTDYIVTGKFTGTRYELYINGVLENHVDYSTKISDWVWDIGAGVSGTYSFPFNGIVDLKQTFIKINDSFYWNGINSSSTKNNSYLLNETVLQGCLYNYSDDGSAHDFDVYHDANYTQPILVSSGQSYASGTKVDTITVPSHKTWSYTAGGIWTQTNL